MTAVKRRTPSPALTLQIFAFYTPEISGFPTDKLGGRIIVPTVRVLVGRTKELSFNFRFGRSAPTAILDFKHRLTGRVGRVGQIWRFARL